MDDRHHFECTGCGRCCQGWRLPLSMAEAVAWLSDDHPVDVLCQASPWPPDPAPNDRMARHAWATSFPAFSGVIPVRITLTLTAELKPTCPNLRSDMGCAIYGRRPTACRIYPAGLDPFAPSDPTQKRCPTEAWQQHHPALFQDGHCINDQYRHDQTFYHQSTRDDARHHARLCDALGLRHAALANEGCVIYRPDPHAMLAALHSTPKFATSTPRNGNWRIVTTATATADTLTRLGADARPADDQEHPDDWIYHPFQVA